jgi:Na+/proline symporter
MSFALLDWLVIAAFLLLLLGLSLLYTKSAGKNIESFFLGGRKLPWWLAGTSMVATTFAADTPLAITEMVAQDGISGNWLWWNMLAGGMLTTFFFAKYWRRAGVMTELELIEMRYSGAAARFLRGFKALYMGIFMNCLILGWVNLAMMALLQVFFELSSTEAFVYTALLMLLVTLYSMLSGLMGVAVTDAVQFVLAMAGCIVLAVLVLHSKEIGGIQALKQALPADTFRFFPRLGSSSDASASSLALGLGSFFAFVGMQWWASWYPGAEPGGGGYVAQRMMSTKDESHALKATLFFQIAHYALRPWAWIVVGLCALVLYPGLQDPKLGYVYAMRDYLPIGLRGMLFVAFLAAYMSTVSTHLNWGASYLIGDLYRRFLEPLASEQHYVWASRLSTLLIAIIALCITPQLSSIKAVWSFLLECGAGLGLVLILRWYWWRINAWTELVATLAPFVGYALGHFVWKWAHPQSFFFTVSFTTLAWLLTMWLTAPTDLGVLQAFCLKIQPQGSWKPVYASLQQKAPASSLGILGICWLSGVLGVYSVLFMIGSFILQDYKQAAGYTALALLSLLALFRFSGKIRLFE